jgi:hypothetical protein
MKKTPNKNTVAEYLIGTIQTFHNQFKIPKSLEFRRIMREKKNAKIESIEAEFNDCIPMLKSWIPIIN